MAVALVVSAVTTAATPNAPASIVELQPQRIATRTAIGDPADPAQTATLIDLAPDVGVWWLLRIDGSTAAAHRDYHLENPRGVAAHPSLVAGRPGELRLSFRAGEPDCVLDVDAARGPLTRAVASGLPFAPVCDGRLYLRNRVTGRASTLERVTDFLRDHVPGGDRAVEIVKERAYRDAFLKESGPRSADAAPRASAPGLPAAARVADAAQATDAPGLGIALAGANRPLRLGEWYAVAGLDGVALSVLTPQAIAPSILNDRDRRVAALGAVEGRALAYLVAFDLAQLDLHFAVGTEHPRLGWSERTLEEVRVPEWPGPDGIDTPAPLVTNGMIAPADVPRAVAAFTGGFKREHGAFRYGPLARVAHGSHYGFVEEGVTLSVLQPGLATVYATASGEVGMKTWEAADAQRLGALRYARQNGLPLIEFDATRGAGVPGAMVAQWGAGNWSGSADKDLRTLRAGLCLQAGPRGRFLIYGWFSDATPSAMARVFQAYGCRYAMHLDMNALEHTYLALYVSRPDGLLLEHLVDGMEVLDRRTRRGLAARFLAMPDDRDFFYLTRRVPP